MRNLHDFIKELNQTWQNINHTAITTEIISIIDRSKVAIEEFSTKTTSNSFGIYVFYIKPNSEYTLKKLQKEWYLDSFTNYPKVVKTRFEKYTVKEDGWIPFYVGKSEKLFTRINEHLTHPKMHKTFGLKLLEREEFKKNNLIKVGFWSLNSVDTPKEINQFVITHYEKEIRQILNPWIGKQ